MHIVHTLTEVFIVSKGGSIKFMFQWASLFPGTLASLHPSLCCPSGPKFSSFMTQSYTPSTAPHCYQVISKSLSLIVNTLNEAPVYIFILTFSHFIFFIYPHSTLFPIIFHINLAPSCHGIFICAFICTPNSYLEEIEMELYFSKENRGTALQDTVHEEAPESSLIEAVHSLLRQPC